MEQSIPVYKEMRILEFEGVVLQNNRLFVYDQSQKSLSTTFDNYFHKTTDHNSLNGRITKTSTYGLESITSSLIRD